MGIIVGANRKETRITITLPVDREGDYAYDEEGNPIKGRTPFVFTVPRLDCVTRAEAKALGKSVQQAAEMKDEDGSELTVQERGIEMTLAMLRPFVDDETLNLCAGLRLFELEQVANDITNGSSTTVGELLASSDS